MAKEKKSQRKFWSFYFPEMELVDIYRMFYNIYKKWSDSE